MAIINLDPREYPVDVNDIVVLSGHDLEWRVTKVIGGTLYLRSLLGGRFGIETYNTVRKITRDTKYQREPDHTLDYNPFVNDDELV